MMRGSTRACCMGAWAAMCVALVAGCPLDDRGHTGLALDAAAVAPVPGEYYVTDTPAEGAASADEPGRLRYAALPARGEQAAFAPLGERASAAWFAGPGWYALDESGSWTVVEPAGLDAFDDALQVHDPLPAVE